MVKTWATLVFIAVIAAGALVVGTRSTVANGSVLGADLLKQIREKNKHIDKLECDRDIPIGVNGAVFECTVTADDGSSARLKYMMDRDGSLRNKVLDSTGPTRKSSRSSTPSTPSTTGSGDPWGK